VTDLYGGDVTITPTMRSFGDAASAAQKARRAARCVSPHLLFLHTTRVSSG
jgi:hypothetical protein